MRNLFCGITKFQTIEYIFYFIFMNSFFTWSFVFSVKFSYYNTYSSINVKYNKVFIIKGIMMEPYFVNIVMIIGRCQNGRFFFILLYNCTVNIKKNIIIFILFLIIRILCLRLYLFLYYFLNLKNSQGTSQTSLAYILHIAITTLIFVSIRNKPANSVKIFKQVYRFCQWGW